MLEFFSMIGKSISLMFSMLGNMISSLFRAISGTFQSVGTVLGIVPFLPSVIGTCVVLTVSICVLNYLLGRNGGG